MKAAPINIGKFYLDRQVKPKKRWKQPDVPAYDPNWVVEFRLPNTPRRRESSKLPICARCLSVKDSPTEARKSCECQIAPRTWAENRLRVLTDEWLKNHLNPKAKDEEKPLMLTEVETVYLERGPDEREKNITSLRLIVELTKGIPFERVAAADLHPDDWDKWAWLYQEYERRGYTERGYAEPQGERGQWAVPGVSGTFTTRQEAVEAAREARRPGDAWEQCRKAMPAHPDPDRESTTPGNTSILSRMREAKSVLGPDSRDSYIKPLRDRLPDSVQKWWSTRIKIRTADGRFSLPREVYEKMWGGLPTLKQDDPQVWALIRLHWTTGVRPIEAKNATLQWLEVAAGTPTDEGPPEPVVMLVVRNRFDDDELVDGAPVKGFRLKSRTTHQARVWPLPRDLMQVIRRIASPGGSILGCALEGQWDRIYRRASDWLRSCGVEGHQTLYNLRKLVGTVKVAKEGQDAGAAALGHSTAKTTMTYYAGQSAPIKALHDDDLAPEAVMGAARSRFTL